MKEKFRTLQDRLREELKSRAARKVFEEEYLKLKLAMYIAELRKKKRMTQKAFAAKMRTSQAAVSRIEKGDYDGFTLKTLQRIAQATGTRLEIRFLPKKKAS